MKIPNELVAGDSVSWIDEPTRDNLGNAITSTDWTLKYSLRGADTLDLTAIAEGSGWKTSITSIQSDALPSGKYFWQAFATKGSDRVTLGSGQLVIKANLLNEDAGFDGRSQVEKDLEAVQSAIRSMVAGGAVQEYTIGTRSLKKMAMPDLLQLESRLKAELSREKAAEKIKNGLGNPFKLFVRF